MLLYLWCKVVASCQLYGSVAKANQKLMEQLVPVVCPEKWRINEDEVCITETKLGRGCFGSVYLGTYQGKSVAVKITRRMENEPLESFFVRFNVELRALMLSRDCLHIVDCIGGYVRNAYSACLVMDYYPQSLHSFLEAVENTPSSCPLSISMKVDMCYQCMFILEDARVLEVLHSDIKCDNILVRSGGGIDNEPPVLVLCDFGLAKNVGDLSEGIFGYGKRRGRGYKWDKKHYHCSSLAGSRGASYHVDLFSMMIVMIRILCGYNSSLHRNVREFKTVKVESEVLKLGEEYRAFLELAKTVVEKEEMPSGIWSEVLTGCLKDSLGGSL